MMEEFSVRTNIEIRNWKFWKVIDYVAFFWQVCEILSIRNKIGWLKGFFEERLEKKDQKIKKGKGKFEFFYIMYKKVSKLKIFKNSSISSDELIA